MTGFHFYVETGQDGVIVRVGHSDQIPPGAVVVTQDDALRVVEGAILRDGRVIPPLTHAPSFDHVLDSAGTWVVPPDRAWARVRYERDQRLAASDWIVTRAQERGEPVPPDWLAYRQALRDITAQPDPENIHWPTAPG